MNFTQALIVFLVWVFLLAEFLIFSTLFLPLIFKHNRFYFYILFPSLVIFFCLMCYSYYKTTFTDPGSPSADINSFFSNLKQIKEKAQLQQQIKHAIHSGKHPHLQTQFDQVESLQNISYCFKCNKVKEIRTHHCRTCGKCILRMDHHCPWIGNCVGRYNHKYFLLFLFYAIICVFIVSCVLLADYMKKRPWTYQLSEKRFYILYGSIFSAAMIGLGVMFLFGAQIYFLSMNLTTIESFVNGMSISQPFKKETFTENMAEIMGDSFWLLPSAPFKNQNPYHSYIQL